MKVLVRGVGNIGTTLANLLLVYSRPLGIAEIVLHKGRPARFAEPSLALLEERGATVYRADSGLSDAMRDTRYVFDCRAAGMPLADRTTYESNPMLTGVSAQGTEHGFGVPFVTGINDTAVRGARFVQVASCNTHASCTLIRVLSGGHVHQGDTDFVVVRRSEDLSAHERLVSATVVARHRDLRFGTHHAVDARRVFETVGSEPRITSSDATTPSQLLHTIRFKMRFDDMPPHEELLDRLSTDSWIAGTALFDSNRLFDLGRRYGFQGRLYAHAIIVDNNLLFSDDSVTGWAFVPQEGNTLLSTIDAFLLQTGHASRASVIASIRSDLLRARW